MNKTSKTIIFFGNERLATSVSTEAPTLQRLIAAGYCVDAVVVNNDTAQSRKMRPLEVAEIAKKHDILVLSPSKLSEIKQFIIKSDARVAVLVAYGKIIPAWLIELFPYGIINIHPSLLPLHRGPTPIESAIRDGDHHTGVSLMQLSNRMDAGPVYAQETTQLSGEESKQNLADTLLELGCEMLERALPNILDGTAQPMPQDDANATYDTMIQKQDGIIRWEEPAEQIARKIRAYAGWPNSRTTLVGKEVIITQAHAVAESIKGKPGDIAIDSEIGGILICTSSGSLCIDKLKPAGKQEMTSQAFLAGYGKNL